jgi:hypothetical protein
MIDTEPLHANDHVARFINGESIEIGVTETDKTLAAQIYESDRHKELLEAGGQSLARAKVMARGELEEERRAKFLRAGLQTLIVSFESD